MNTYGLLGKSACYKYLRMIHEQCGRYRYDEILLSAEQAKQFVSSAGFSGVNVTEEFSHAAYSLCDGFSDTASKTEAVDTIIVQNGKLIGHNASVFGFKALFESRNVDVSNRVVLYIGMPDSIDLASLKVIGAGRVINIASADELTDDCYDAEIIIARQNKGELDLKCFKKLMFAADINCVPLQSKILLDARKAGINASDGVPHLTGMALHSASLFGGQGGDLKKLCASVRNDAMNISLTGMPLSGKTTVGRLLEGLSGKRFVDIDAKIEKRASMPIRKIFQMHGEAYFRRLEREVISEFSDMNGLIISTGGGAVMDERNYYALTKNSRVYCLDRNITTVKSGNRPLCNDIDEYKKLYAERKERYVQRCDVLVENNISPQNTAEKIMEDYYEAINN